MKKNNAKLLLSDGKSYRWIPMLQARQCIKNKEVDVVLNSPLTVKCVDSSEPNGNTSAYYEYERRKYSS